MATFYFCIAVLSFIGTATAIIQARRLHWLVPVYFLSGWLVGELAIIHLILQLGLTAVIAFTGILDAALAQSALGIFALSWLGLLYLHIQALDTGEYTQAALRRALGDNYRDTIPASRRALLTDTISSRYWLRPFHFKREGVRMERHVSYGNAGTRNLLDLYLPVEPADRPRPVLLQVHGGAWMIGSKEEQAKPLMYHMSQRGWLCVSINYRLSPDAAFPAHIIDVKKAIAWIRQNIEQYGGDPDFIAITGGSAGGHLSSLASLTPGLTQWQPDFEEVDTSIQAAVPFYGVYDFLDRNNIRAAMPLDKFLAERVMQCTLEDNRELWDDASPTSHVNTEAPPTYVIQGTHDSLVWVEEARAFVAALQSVSNSPVAYAELPGAQHAFEIFHSVRTDLVVNSAAEFLEWSHARHLAKAG